MARILITSALPYINGIKHLGNLAGSMLPADVYARFKRAQKNEVLYICATDEHGTPAELAASAAGQDIAEYCMEQHDIQDRLCRAYGLSWDWFGRSSSPENRLLTQHFAQVLENNGYIEERVDRMIYSIDDARFLPDRYVEGTCPYCEHRPTRGDQCDNCSRLIAPSTLIDPYSAISGSTNLEVRDTRHLYLLQSKLAERIGQWVESKTNWPSLALSIGRKHLEEGLADRGITRDLNWGIPVVRNGMPRPGFEHKVFYVWFDAPIEYISATQEWSHATGNDWQRWWLTDKGADDVEYVQFMGKDNVNFHVVNFPATILGSREPWKLVDTLKAFSWLNWYGGKFSTSRRRGLFMDKALELLPADMWRWYLSANSPESSDTAFSWSQFQSTINRDLADVFGNFVNRILKFCDVRFGGQVPSGGNDGELEARLYETLSRQIVELTALLETMEIRKAAQELRAIWVTGNEYLTEAAPWKAIKTDPERAALVVRVGVNLVGLYSRLSTPFVPFAAKAIGIALGDDAVEASWPTADAAYELARIRAESAIQVPEVLFQKIDDDQLTKWSDQFPGDPAVAV